MDIRMTYIVNASYMQVLTLKAPTPQNSQTLFLTNSKSILSLSPENIRKPHFVDVLWG